MLKKILITIKFILINLGNGFIHQTSHVFSFSDDFILCRWLVGRLVSILYTILPININDFLSAKSEYFLACRLSKSSIKHEKSAGHFVWTVHWVFFPKLCVLFCSSFAFVNFLVMFIVARTFPSLFLLLNICPSQRLQPDLYYMFTDVRSCLFTKSHGQVRKCHIRNSNKNLLHGPGYHYVNAVQFSLQSGRITQLRTCTILVILAAFETPLMRSFPI